MAEEGFLALSQRDRDRLKELHGVIRRQIAVREAARRVKLSPRQVRRLLKRVRSEGDRGVIHRLRGRRSNRRLGEKVRAKALALLRRPEYRDFGPTLGSEHLARRDVVVSRETLRRWMVEEGLWRGRQQRIEQIHIWRERRAAFGELVLMDSSDHAWLEGRGPRIWLVAMIDDASSRLWARFVERDTTEENLRTLRGWLERYGRPLALYTDKDSIFVTSRSRQQIEQWGPAPATDFAEALAELGIEWIAAHSPQAKGRVERLFETLQDRLLKELRVAHVSTLEAANQFLEEWFLPFWQERFTVEARQAHDAHRPLGTADLDSVLCLRETRKLTSDYTLSLNRQRWAISRDQVRPGLRNARVLVERRLDGSLWARFRGHHLQLRAAPAAKPCGLRPPGLAAKPKLKVPPWPKPAPDHPWRTSWSKRSLLLGRQADTSTLR
jgi:DNA-binding Lrp family transcriptional regulator